MDANQRFYRHFQDSVAILQDQMDQLGGVAAVAGERQEATDHVLAGIAKLQNEVADAAAHAPSYDRKQYAEAIKGLHDKLNGTMARVTPRSRFQFRRGTPAHVDMGAPENDPRLRPGSLSRNAHARRPADALGEAVAREGSDAVGALPTHPGDAKDYNAELSRPGAPGIRRPSFSAATSIAISNQSGLHIILPSSAARAASSGSLTDLRGCIVDMSVPTAQGKPLPGLALNRVHGSLVVAGRVSGPVHVTGMTDSILVVAAQQVRIHECSNVDVYLHCTSHPIIEDCTGMRFAPLPQCHMTEADAGAENQWNKVDDFKWFKAGQSPNWTSLAPHEALADEIWTRVVPGQPGVSVEETLKRVGIPPAK